MLRIYLLVATVVVLSLVTTFSACLMQPRPEPFAVAWNFDTSGYLEPCGCSTHMLGGLPRRATVIKRLREKQPLVAIEGPHMMEAAGEFQLFKGQTIVRALNTMEYDALIVGLREAQQGIAGLTSLKEMATFPLICANLKHEGEALAVPSTILELPGVSVGITGITQPNYIADAELPDEISFIDPAPALAETLDSMNNHADFIIVSLEGQGVWVDEMTAKFSKQAHLFLSGAREGDASLYPFREDPPRLNNFELGKYLGIATVDPVEDGFKVAGKNEALTDEIPDAPEISEIFEKEFKPKLKDMFFATFKGDIEQLYLPPDYCADCHTSEHEVYASSKHFAGRATLEAEGQLYNPDCMKCHVVYDAAEDELHSINCVVCHTNITEDHVFAAMEGQVVRPETPVTTYTYDYCYRCHDELNSLPFKDHWPQYVNLIYHGGDKSAAESAAAALGIDMNEAPPEGVMPEM